MTLLKQIAFIQDENDSSDEFTEAKDMYGEVAENFAPLLTFQNLSIDAFIEIDVFLQNHISKTLRTSIIDNIYTLEVLTLITKESFSGTCSINQENRNSVLDELFTKAQTAAKEITNQAYNSMLDRDLYIDKEIYLMIEYTEHLKGILTKQIHLLKVLETFFPSEVAAQNEIKDKEAPVTNVTNTFDSYFTQSKEFNGFVSKLDDSTTKILENLYYLQLRTKRQLKKITGKTSELQEVAKDKVEQFKSTQSSNFFETMGKKSFEIKTQLSNFKRLSEGLAEHFSTSPYPLSITSFNTMLNDLKKDLNEFDIDLFFSKDPNNEEEQEEQVELREIIKNQISDRMILIQELEYFLSINSHESYQYKDTIKYAIQTYIRLKEAFDVIEHAINSKELLNILENEEATTQELLEKRRQLTHDIELAKNTIDPNSKLSLQATNIDNLQEMVSTIDEKIDTLRLTRENNIELDSDLLSLKETINGYFLLENADTELHIIPQFYEKFSNHIQLLIQGKVELSSKEEQNDYWDVLLKSIHLLMQQKPSFFQNYYENPLQLICLSLSTYSLSVENALESPLFNKALRQYENYIEQFSTEKIQKRNSISVPIASSFQKINTKFELRNFILFTKKFMEEICHDDLKFTTAFENALLSYTIFNALQESKLDYALIEKNPSFNGLTYTSFGKKKESQIHSSLSLRFKEKDIKDHSATDFSTALNECFTLIVNRTPLQNGTHQTIVPFLKDQHTNLALREDGKTKLLSLPTTTRKSINGFYLLYFLTAFATNGDSDSLEYKPGRELKIDDLRANKFNNPQFLLSKLLKVVTQKLKEINETLDKKSVGFKQRSYTLPPYQFEYNSPFTEDLNSIKECSIETYKTEMNQVKEVLESTLKMEIERESGPLSELGFSAFLETGKKGKLSESCLNKFSDSGYTLVSNYLYPLQLIDHTLSKLNGHPPENQLSTLALELRFLKQPATPETLSKLAQSEYFNKINETKTLHLCKVLSVMDSLLGGSPIQDSQVTTMLLPMYRCSQGSNHFEFIIQNMGEGKTTMAKLISHFTDVISIHVAPFKEEEWSPFSVESLQSAKPGHHFGMNPSELNTLITTLDANTDLKEHYSKLNVMYYIDEYSSGKYLTDENRFIYALGSQYIKKAVYMSGTPNIASLKMSLANTQHLLESIKDATDDTFSQETITLVSEQAQLTADINRVERLKESTLQDIEGRIEFIEDIKHHLTSLITRTSDARQNLAIIQPDISYDEEQTYVLELATRHPHVAFTYLDPQGITTLSKNGETTPLSSAFDATETYVSSYSTDAIGGDRKNVSKRFTGMLIQTRNSKFETESNFIQYFHRLRGNLKSCQYYISLSSSTDVTDFQSFIAHIQQLETKISTSLSRINIDSNIASISEELIKFYIQEAISIENKTNQSPSEKTSQYSLLWFQSIQSKIESNIQKKLISETYLTKENIVNKIKKEIKIEIQKEINSKIGKIKIHCLKQAESIMTELNDTLDFSIPENDLENLYEKLATRIFFPLFYALLGTKISNTNVEIKSTSSRVGLLSLMTKSTVSTGSVAATKVKTVSKYMLRDIVASFLNNLIQNPDHILNQGNEKFKINEKNFMFKTYYADLFSGIEEIKALLENTEYKDSFIQKNRAIIKSLVETQIISIIKSSNHKSKSLEMLLNFCKEWNLLLSQNINKEFNDKTKLTEFLERIIQVEKASSGKNAETTFGTLNKSNLLISLSKIKKLIESVLNPVNTYYQSLLQETLNRLVKSHLNDETTLRFGFTQSQASAPSFNFPLAVKDNFYFTFDAEADSAQEFLVKMLSQLDRKLTDAETLPKKGYILTNYEFWINQLKENDPSAPILETLNEET